MKLILYIIKLIIPNKRIYVTIHGIHFSPAHTFTYHHLNIYRADVKVAVNRKVSSRISLFNRIRNFFKQRPLENKVYWWKRYSLWNKVHDSRWCFASFRHSEAFLKNETLVVQVVNRRGKILRELWLGNLYPEDFWSFFAKNVYILIYNF